MLCVRLEVIFRYSGSRKKYAFNSKKLLIYNFYWIGVFPEVIMISWLSLMIGKEILILHLRGLIILI